jgi:hypothetical protein
MLWPRIGLWVDPLLVFLPFQHCYVAPDIDLESLVRSGQELPRLC